MLSGSERPPARRRSAAKESRASMIALTGGVCLLLFLYLLAALLRPEWF
jgi:K+-transporting ATPase KdpF subunit